MATLTVQSLASGAIEPTNQAVSASDEFPNDGFTTALITNGDVSANTVTFISQQTVAAGGDTLAVADLVVTVPAGESRDVPPLNKTVFNDSSGNVTVTNSNTTSNTIYLRTVINAT